MKQLTFKFFLPLIIFFAACNPTYRAQKAEYHNYRVGSEFGKDPETDRMMKPYRDSIWRQMEEVVGVFEKTMEKATPSSSLGNFVTDAVMIKGSEKFNVKIDAAFQNYGGIRLTQMAAGNVTRGKLFELMPFDNVIVLLRMKGDVLQQFLDVIASKGGWPSAGLTFDIKDKKAINVQIGQKPIDMNATYVVAFPDYVANGGDELAMLATLPQQTVGYLVRDAIIDYVLDFTKKGLKIHAHSDIRIKNAQ